MCFACFGYPGFTFTASYSFPAASPEATGVGTVEIKIRKYDDVENHDKDAVMSAARRPHFPTLGDSKASVGSSYAFSFATKRAMYAGNSTIDSIKYTQSDRLQP